MVVRVPESDPGMSPQACAGEGSAGEEESEEGGGSTAAHLLEALRQFRLHHRGQYHSVLEEALAAYRLPGENTAATEGTGETQETSDDQTSQSQEEEEQQPASPPSPPSPPPSPATAEMEVSQDASTSIDQPDSSA